MPGTRKILSAVALGGSDVPFRNQDTFESKGSGKEARFVARAAADPGSHGSREILEIIGKIEGDVVRITSPTQVP